jgi:hypothetical protein
MKDLVFRIIWLWFCGNLSTVSLDKIMMGIPPAVRPSKSVLARRSTKDSNADVAVRL